MTTTTSDSMMKPSENVASGPLARVCDKMPMQAEGLRVTQKAPHNKATPKSGRSSRSRANGMKRAANRKKAAMPTITATD